MPESDDLTDIQQRLTLLEERIERFERIYQEWSKIEEWIKSLPEYGHRSSPDTQDAAK